MKIQLLATIVVLMCLSVHCKPAYRNGKPCRTQNTHLNPEVNDGILEQAPLNQNTPIDAEQDNVAGLANPPVQEVHEPESDDDEEEEEEELDVWNMSQMGKNGGAINFFPIMFGIRRNTGRSEGFPAGTVAIANSYSTGRRGVATSNANANGDPAVLFRNGNPQMPSFY